MNLNEYWLQVLLLLVVSYVIGYGGVRVYQGIRRGGNRR